MQTIDSAEHVQENQIDDVRTEVFGVRLRRIRRSQVRGQEHVDELLQSLHLLRQGRATEVASSDEATQSAHDRYALELDAIRQLRALGHDPDAMTASAVVEASEAAPKEPPDVEPPDEPAEVMVQVEEQAEMMAEAATEADGTPAPVVAASSSQGSRTHFDSSLMERGSSCIDIAILEISPAEEALALIPSVFPAATQLPAFPRSFDRGTSFGTSVPSGRNSMAARRSVCTLASTREEAHDAEEPTDAEVETAAIVETVAAKTAAVTKAATATKVAAAKSVEWQETYEQLLKASAEERAMRKALHAKKALAQWHWRIVQHSVFTLRQWRQLVPPQPVAASKAAKAASVSKPCQGVKEANSKFVGQCTAWKAKEPRRLVPVARLKKLLARSKSKRHP